MEKRESNRTNNKSRQFHSTLENRESNRTDNKSRVSQYSTVEIRESSRTDNKSRQFHSTLLWKTGKATGQTKQKTRHKNGNKTTTSDNKTTSSREARGRTTSAKAVIAGRSTYTGIPRPLQSSARRCAVRWLRGIEDDTAAGTGTDTGRTPSAGCTHRGGAEGQWGEVTTDMS